MRLMTDSLPVTAILIAPLRTSISSLLVGAMLITTVPAAYADKGTPSKQDATNLDQESTLLDQESKKRKQDSKKAKRDSKKLKRQILASLDDPELGLKATGESPEARDGSGFRISKKGPIQYRHTFQIGNDEVLFKFYGPVVKKKPGLRFRVEGLRIGDHPVRVDGFGNVKEGGLRFTVQF